MRINLLGPVELIHDGSTLPIGPLKRKVVLAALARRAGTTVSVAELVDAVWDDSPPRSAACNLRTYLSDLRRVVGDRYIRRTAAGYRLLADANDIDVNRFVASAERGHAALAAGDCELARRHLSAAMRLWRGEPFADLGHVAAFAGEVRQLQERRLRILEQRIEADLRSGRAAGTVIELTALVVEHPYHEPFCNQLMLALHRCGRRADALEAFRTARAVLRNDLGVEPGEELQATHRYLLGHGIGWASLPNGGQAATDYRRAHAG